MSTRLYFPGNERIRAQLERVLTGGRLAGSYLFEGAPGAAQELAAVELAAGVIVGDTDPANPDAARVRRWSHPDLHYLLPVLKPSGKAWNNIRPEDLLALFREQQGHKIDDPLYLPQYKSKPHLPIEALRLVMRIVATKPYEGRGKVLIIRDADQMQSEAQDTLLKSLEEPPADTLLILISYRPEALRPTILSRCQRVPFDPLGAEDIAVALAERGVSGERARFLATLADGNLELAAQYAAAEQEEDEDGKNGNALLAARTESLALLDTCEFGSELEMMDAISAFARKGKGTSNPVRARAEFLSLAVSWYREVLRQELEEGPLRVHIDQGERLERYRALGEERLVDRIRRCEKARAQILSYANAELTLLSLFFSLRAGGGARAAT